MFFFSYQPLRLMGNTFYSFVMQFFFFCNILKLPFKHDWELLTNTVFQLLIIVMLSYSLFIHSFIILTLFSRSVLIVLTSQSFC